MNTIPDSTPKELSPDRDGGGIAPLLKDPDYQELLVTYQNAEWEKCRTILNGLSEKYPQEPKIVDFKKDLDVQMLIHNIQQSTEKANRREIQWGIIRWVILGILVAAALGTAAFFIVTQRISEAARVNQQRQAENLLLLESQAKGLIQAGKPEEAIIILDEINATKPDYPNLQTMYDQTSSLVGVNKIYLDAISDIESKKYDAALAKLNNIESIIPNFRDVDNKIQEVNNLVKTSQLINAGQDAYKKGQWGDVIKSYEAAYKINSSAYTTDIKEQLLTAYLKTIINMLENKETKIEDVDQAEGYYRKAISLFPQSKQYATERENLQKLSGDLLKFKYYQMAKKLIEDPNPTVDTTATFVKYLTKASSLDPENIQLKNELNNAQLYQVAQAHFNSMDWPQAIESSTKLSAIDENYGNGKVKQLLYEAYMARGKQYFDMGIYLDARINYEAAENIAFNQKTNLMQLFQVQLAMGQTLGKLRNYKDAASYFKYALNAISIETRISDNPQFIDPLKKADNEFTLQNYIDSYNLYVDTLKSMADVNIPYTYKDFEAVPGSTLAFIASSNLSTVQAIQEHNNLQKIMVVNGNVKLSIPYIK